MGPIILRYISAGRLTRQGIHFSRPSEAGDGLCRAYRGEAEQGKAPVALFSAERARHGGRALALQAKQGKQRVRSCERPYMNVWAGLQTKHGMRSEAGVALQVFTACLEKCIPCRTGVAWRHTVKFITPNLIGSGIFSQPVNVLVARGTSQLPPCNLYRGTLRTFKLPLAIFTSS